VYVWVRIGMEPLRGTLPMCRSWIRDSGRDPYQLIIVIVLYLQVVIIDRICSF
jgi:hypothetical protein